MRTTVYIDGFNLYYAIRSSGYKWLNLNALRTLPEVEIHFGTFLAKDVWRPVVNLPVADREIETGRFEAAAVPSNDTDLVEPIRIVTQELHRPVILLCPSAFGASKPLLDVATSVRHIHRTHLLASAFPDRIPGTTISKPVGW